MCVAKLDFAGLREMDMVDYLFGIGYEPDKIRGHDYWYRSPIRDEQTPSFKINRRINRWYDHGIGKGGNLIDFGIAFYHCSPLEFLQKIDNGSFHDSLVARQPAARANEPEVKINITGDAPLAATGLLLYLDQRHIPADVAQFYCREVRYEMNGRHWYGIGFKNDAGGYEIRNAYFKGSSAPKTITSLIRDAGRISVFEGFMDFLSHQIAFSEQSGNYLILNSIGLFERAMPVLRLHEEVQLFFDRDKSGMELTAKALRSGRQFQDASKLYRDHKDLNEWLVAGGQVKNKRVYQGIKH